VGLRPGRTPPRTNPTAASRAQGNNPRAVCQTQPGPVGFHQHPNAGERGPALSSYTSNLPAMTALPFASGQPEVTSPRTASQAKGRDASHEPEVLSRVGPSGHGTEPQLEPLKASVIGISASLFGCAALCIRTRQARRPIHGQRAAGDFLRSTRHPPLTARTADTSSGLGMKSTCRWVAPPKVALNASASSADTPEGNQHCRTRTALIPFFPGFTVKQT
jgi:hypothetical protein